MSDSPVIAFLNKATDLILLNLIWILTSLPIVTIGASTTAMYYVTIVSLRNGDGYVVQRYIKSFRENFKLATLLWLPMLFLSLLMGFDLFFWYQMHTGFAKIMFCFSMLIAFLLLIIMEYIFPVLAKLEGDFKTTIKNAAKFSIGYFPYTMVILVFSIGFVVTNLTSLAMNAITVFIGFALIAYIKSFFYYKVFMNHIPEKYDDFDHDPWEEKVIEE